MGLGGPRRVFRGPSPAAGNKLSRFSRPPPLFSTITLRDAVCSPGTQCTFCGIMLTSATTTDLTSQCEGGGGGGGTISPPFHPFRCCTVGQTEAKRKCANRYAEHFRDGSEHRIQQLQSADCHCQPDGERTLWQDTVVRLQGEKP